MVSLQLVLFCLPSSSLCYREQESLGIFQATAFALGPPPRPPNAAFQITLSRPWAGGPVMHINFTLEPQWNQFWKFLAGYFSNRYLIRSGSVPRYKRLRVWPFGARASPSQEPVLRALAPWLGGPFGLVWGLMAGLRCCASHGGIISI